MRPICENQLIKGRYYCRWRAEKHSRRYGSLSCLICYEMGPWFTDLTRRTVPFSCVLQQLRRPKDGPILNLIPTGLVDAIEQNTILNFLFVWGCPLCRTYYKTSLVSLFGMPNFRDKTQVFKIKCNDSFTNKFSAIFESDKRPMRSHHIWIFLVTVGVSC